MKRYSVLQLIKQLYWVTRKLCSFVWNQCCSHLPYNEFTFVGSVTLFSHLHSYRYRKLSTSLASHICKSNTAVLELFTITDIPMFKNNWSKNNNLSFISIKRIFIFLNDEISFENKQIILWLEVNIRIDVVHCPLGDIRLLLTRNNTYYAYRKINSFETQLVSQEYQPFWDSSRGTFYCNQFFLCNFCNTKDFAKGKTKVWLIWRRETLC